MSSPIEHAWSHLSDLASIRSTYEATSDERFTLALARSAHPSSNLPLAITEEATGPIMEPLLLARILAEPEAAKKSQLLSCFRPACSPRSIPTLREILKAADDTKSEILKKGKDPWGARRWQNVAAYAAAFLARAGDPSEALLRVKEDRGLFVPLLTAHAGIADAIDALKTTDEDGEGPLRFAAQLCEALADAGAKDAVPAMIALVRSGIAPHALAALGKLGDARAVDVARAIHRETLGDRIEVALYRLSAESILVQHGGAWSLDLARSALEIRQARYGRPKAPEVLLLRRLAGEALLTSGDPADRARVAELVHTRDRALRDLARRAGFPTAVTAWDAGRIAWATGRPDGAAAMVAALHDPKALLQGELALHLSQEGDDAQKLAVAAWAKARLEREPGPYVDSEHEADPDLHAALRAGRRVAESSGPRAVLAASSHPWITAGALATEKPAYVNVAPTTSARPYQARNFDEPAFFFPEGITTLALASDAERMLVVTPKRCVLFDPRASKRLTTLEGTADAAATTADGATLALARGETIALFAADGTAGLTLPLPRGARALAFSADGKWLAAGGDGATLRVFELASGKEVCAVATGGPIRGLGWAGPKRVVALADEGASSRVFDLDVGKKKSTHVELPARCIHLSTFKKLTLVAGGRNVGILDAKLAPKHSFEAEREVLGAALETEKTALLRSAGGVARAHFAGKALKWSAGRQGPVDAFAATASRLYAASDGTISRHHEDPEGQVAEGAHYKHPSTIVPLPDGTIATAAWDGRVLVWPRSGGVAKTLSTRSRIDDLGFDGKHLYVGHEHSIFRIALADGATDAIVGGDDVEEDLKKLMPKVESLAARGERLAWGEKSGVVHVVRVSDGTELFAPKLTEAELEALVFDDEGNLYGSSERGEIARLNADGTVAWSRLEHGIDVVDGRLLGNPHRTAAAIAAGHGRVASLASDHTVRVFDAKTGARTLRIFRPVGIFDHLAFSPDGKHLAFTWGGYLEIVDAADGAPVAFVDGHVLPGARGGSYYATLMTVAWLDAKTLLVGAETGRHFEVTLG